MRSISSRLWLLAIGSAILQALPFALAGPVPSWRRLFCWFALTPLIAALLAKSRTGTALRPAQTALLGYCSGVIWYLCNCYWIYQTMHTYGDLPKPAAYGILLLFSLYVALYHGLFGWCVGWLLKKWSREAVLWMVPFIWVSVELARARVTGFPWDLLGYTQVDNLTLSRLAPWTGVMGLSFVVAMVNSLWLMRSREAGRRNAMLWPGVAVAVVLAATLLSAHPLTRQRADVEATAVLLQENLKVGSEASGPPETRGQMLAAFDELSIHPTLPVPEPGVAAIPAALLAAKPAIIAWPEAPTDFYDADPQFRESMGALAIRTKTPVIVNDVAIAGRNPDGHFTEYNSAALFHTDGRYGVRYDKMRLVPFGEYTPYKALFFFAGHLLDNLPFVPGLERKVFVAEGKRYGVFICYESIFGDDIRHFAGDGAQVLVNISDDGWYGDSSAPWEHLDMVRMRAIENDRWVVRATNTGVTASIDPFGRVTATIPRHIRGSMLAGFTYRDDRTFYTRFGDWFAWVCTIVVAAVFLFGHVRRREVH
jgi:apolipoprotein N-acyltransferase